MQFALKEIRNYLIDQLKKGHHLPDAIDKMTESNIVACNDVNLFYRERNDENLEKYEMKIGMYDLKNEQAELYRSTNGKQGKYWLACSPKWIDKEVKKRHGTQFEIYYWVNYGDDETFGSFTVEQIKQWLTIPNCKLHMLGGTRERIKDSL